MTVQHRFHHGVLAGAVGVAVATGAALAAPAPAAAQAAGPATAASAEDVHAQVDFTTTTGALVAGYARDGGEAYSDARGYGWVRQDSATPLRLVGNGRVQTGSATTAVDPLLRSYVHMQYSGTASIATPGRWELAVPNGRYEVTIGAGDPNYLDSVHRVTAEGTAVVEGFTPTSAQRTHVGTATVTVTDGRLTLDAAGGTNTKIGYVTVDGVATPPTEPPPVEPPPAEPSTGALTVTVPGAQVLDDTSRFVFSTAQDAPLTREVVLGNTGTGPLRVSGLTFSGADAGRFALAPGQPGTLTVAPGASAAVAVTMTPVAGTAEYRAALEVTTDAGSRTVTLAGLNAVGLDGAAEPTMAQIVRTLGYSSDVIGTEQQYLGSTRAPRGQEVVSPYWVAADTSQPVSLEPVGRFTALTTTCPCDRTGHVERGGVKAELHSFGADPSTTARGAANQTLLPVRGGSGQFTATSPFLLYGNNGNASDDGRNANQTHVMRFWPLVLADGTRVADAWLVGFDTGTTNKNYDYQDVVYLLRNAAPELTPAATPGTAPLALSFSAAVTGSVADTAGRGTGFTGVQANTAGDQRQPALVALDTAAGVLRLTSAPGTSTGSANTQRNALSTEFDASRSTTATTARFLAPFTAIDASGDNAAVWFGPDQDDFLKVEITGRAGAQVVQAYYEAGSTTPYENRRTVVGTPVPVPAGTRAVELRITTTNTTGTLTASYRFDPASATAPWTDLGQARPVDVMRWLSARATAGVLTSTGSGDPFTAVLDSFAVRKS